MKPLADMSVEQLAGLVCETLLFSVSGTATAASIWTAGLIGIAVATDRFEIATILSLITFLTLRHGRTVKKSMSSSDERS